MKKGLLRNSLILVLIICAALSRLIPHPVNFTAVGAIAIFAAFTVHNRLAGLLIPVAAMWVSDIILNNIIYTSAEFTWFTPGAFWIYLGMSAHTFIGWYLRKPSITNIAGTSLTGATLFFILSNFGVWMAGGMYSLTFDGLLLCYTAAIPFFGHFLAANLIFSAILFGIYFVFERKTGSFQAV